jgi:hypothetical protein
MSQQAEFAPSGICVRQYVSKVGKVHFVAPDMQTITDNAVNGYERINAAGIPTPNAAPTLSNVGGTGPTGTYQPYITFYDSNNDAEGNPIQAAADITVANDAIRVTRTDTNGATNTRVTHWRVYAQQSGGTTYTRVGTIAIGTTTFDIAVAEATWAATDEMEQDNTAPVATTYGLTFAHKGFNWLGGPYNQVGGTDYDHRVIFSKVGNCDAYPAINATQVLNGESGILRAFGAVGDQLLLFKDTAIVAWMFDKNPHLLYGDGTFETFSRTRGALNQRCVVDLGGQLIVMDQLGIYLYSSGTQFTELSRPLWALWSRINWNNRDRFCGVAQRDRVWFFITLDEDTENHWALVFDLAAYRSGRGVRWWLDYYDASIRDCAKWDTGEIAQCATLGMRYESLPVVLTKSGHVFALGCGYRDGVAPQLTAEAVLSGSTSTTISLTAGTYTTTNSASDTVDVRGCFVRFVDETEKFPDAYLIKTIGGAGNRTLTLDTTFASNPANGTRVVIGPLPRTEYHTPRSAFGMPHQRKNARRFLMEFVARPVNHDLSVEFEHDSFAPQEASISKTETGWYSVANDVKRYVNMGGDFATKGRAGEVRVPIGLKGFRYLKTIIRAEGVDLPGVITALDVDVRTPQPVEAS